MKPAGSSRGRGIQAPILLSLQCMLSAGTGTAYTDVSSRLFGRRPENKGVVTDQTSTYHMCAGGQ
eukprot:4586816-Amphidinium_carterae.2